MEKRKQYRTRASEQDKGKQQLLKPKPETSKRSQKTKEETLRNISQAYMMGTSSQVKEKIYGWEKEIHSNEDNEAEAEIMDFISDPSNTKGRLSLFNQSVHTYWILKCVLAKAMQSTNPSQMNEMQSVIALFQDITIQLQQLKLAQYKMSARIELLGKQLNLNQQVDILGSTAKDPAPVESSDG